MRKRYWLAGMQALMVGALLLICAGQSLAQGLGKKHLPTITLQKWTGPPTGVLARDTNFVSEPGPGEKRFLLLPVFIMNCLDTSNDPINGYPGERIYSFRMKLQYNSTLLRAVGVQKRGQFPNDNDLVVARDFNMSWDIDQDADYKLETVGGPSAYGERIMVTGSSSTALPLPLKPNAPPGAKGCQWGDTAVFFYVLFEVVGDAQGSTSGINTDQMILTLDSLRWNEYAPGRVTPEMEARGFEKFQEGVAPTRILDPNTGEPFIPNTYGTSYISITPRPRIDLLPTSQVAQINSDPSNYELVFPLQTQYGNPNRIFRNILMVNGVQGTKLRNITVATDAPWLRIDSNDVVNPGVGGGGDGTGRGLFFREIGLQQNFNVVANPALLPTADGSGYPTPGIYIGYITLRSVDALNSAVRLRIVLIVNRNPLESGLDTSSEPTSTRGIRLMFRNSAPSPDTTYLTFGTGIGATDAPDLLFGEAEAATPGSVNQFYARFFPPLLGAGFNGLVDTRGLPPVTTNPATNLQSLDIREYRVDTTIVYCVKFSAGAPQNYPVVIEYDTRDFPPNALLYLRDNLNGTIFNYDMRGTTNVGPTTRTIVIRDPNVTGFCIEYTLPSVIQFPEVRERGWNFVSLPVVPSNPTSGTVFPNISSGRPLLFNGGNGFLPMDTVAPGYGYFVKYGDVVDRTVSGVAVKRIDPTLPLYINVRLNLGWNTVGALSVPTYADDTYMTFRPIGSGRSPSRVGEVYSYTPQRGYVQTARILPGLGYWIKVDGSGYYILTAPPSELNGKIEPKIADDYKVLNQLRISDADQKVSTLYFGRNGSVSNSRYELPPAPGESMFDARFSNNGFVSASKEATASHVVSFQGTEYPVVLSVNNADVEYVVSDALTGYVLGTLKQGEAGAIRINNPLVKSVKLTAVGTASTMLGAAYPNPATNTASFEFAVPTEQQVTITLINALGVEVKSLYSGVATGLNRVEIATEGLAAGVYFYKMTTNGRTETRQLVIAN